MIASFAASLPDTLRVAASVEERRAVKSQVKAVAVRAANTGSAARPGIGYNKRFDRSAQSEFRINLSIRPARPVNRGVRPSVVSDYEPAGSVNRNSNLIPAFIRLENNIV